MYPENDYRSYLEHGTKGLHWAWPDHKYLEKTVEGVYLYTKEQVENARKKGKQFVSSVSNTVKDVKDKVSTSFYKTGIGKAVDAKAQERREKKQRKAAKAELPSKRERNKMLKSARKDIKKQYKEIEKAEKAKTKSAKSSARNVLGHYSSVIAKKRDILNKKISDRQNALNSPKILGKKLANSVDKTSKKINASVSSTAKKASNFYKSAYETGKKNADRDVKAGNKYKSLQWIEDFANVSSNNVDDIYDLENRVYSVPMRKLKKKKTYSSPSGLLKDQYEKKTNKSRMLSR